MSDLAGEARALLMRYAFTGAMTPRQEQIVRMLAEGKTLEETGAALGIAAGTVRGQFNRAKLNVSIYEMRKREGKR